MKGVKRLAHCLNAPFFPCLPFLLLLWWKLARQMAGVSMHGVLRFVDWYFRGGRKGQGQQPRPQYGGYSGIDLSGCVAVADGTLDILMFTEMDCKVGELSLFAHGAHGDMPFLSLSGRFKERTPDFPGVEKLYF